MPSKIKSEYKQFVCMIFGAIVGFTFGIIYFEWNQEIHTPYGIAPHQHKWENTSIAEELYKRVRILCWVMTHPKQHRTHAIHVRETWGRHCNKFLFISERYDSELNPVVGSLGSGRNTLWGKTKSAFKFIYATHFDEADWFFKADDDTFAIMENMRYLLQGYSSNRPIYFGAKFKAIVKQGYMSGGAGYVLSKEALRRFVEVALPNPKICRLDDAGDEDVEIGLCLEKIGVIAGDSRDSLQRARFFPFRPEWHLLHHQNITWYWKYIYYNEKDGLECCSDYAISFHYVSPPTMHLLNYIIYHLRPFGIFEGISSKQVTDGK